MTIRERVIAWLDISQKKPAENKMQVKADLASRYGTTHFSIALAYDGEKNLGEMGAPRNYWMDFDRLRSRSWQSYIESDITHTVIKKFIMWVVGTGLRLQCEPEYEILKEEGIELNSESFNESVERRWKLYSNSKSVSITDRMSLNTIAKEVKKNAIIAGDVLVRVRFTKDGMKIQLIDGGNVVTPLGEGLSAKIKYGVEVDENGKHIAYHVRKANTYSTLETERIPARTSSGQEVAFLVYGSQYRTDDVRGIPLIAVVLETLSKMDRYKEATVGSAEERAKIPYFIKHDLGSTGENPMIDSMTKALQGISNQTLDGKLPISDDGVELANTISATTNKQTFNLSPGSDIVSLDSRNDLYFKEFYDVNFNIVCAALCIPPDVAKSLYDSNYSASRAALKDWEHTLKVERRDLTEQFYSKVYSAWLFNEIFTDKVTAPGYVSAYIQKNKLVIEAFQLARFVGDQVPHIDPLKEVQAVRAKLGDLGKNFPLTTVEDACETLDTGDSDSIIKQFSEEIKQSIGLEIPVSTGGFSDSATPEGPGQGAQ